jgi:hypothetical protein
VKPGRVDTQVAKLFAGLQRFREAADYARAFSFDEATAKEEVARAREVRDALLAVLRRGGWMPP